MCVWSRDDDGEGRVDGRVLVVTITIFGVLEASDVVLVSPE